MNNKIQEDPIEKNKERWELLAELHVKAAEAGTALFQDLEGFREGKTSLSPIELAELPDLKGK